MSELELLMSDNEHLQLLGQGQYGCAFYPEISCKTHHVDKNSKYLSKIQFQDNALRREVAVGKRIAERVPNYRLFFAPIVETCVVKLSQLKQDKIKQCAVLSRRGSSPTTSDQEIVSCKVPYVGKLTLEKFFSSLYHKDSCSRVDNRSSCRSVSIIYLRRLVNTYLYLVSTFSKLNNLVGVVHLDVKGDNIMYDSKNNLPILIDFGMSYCVDWLQYPKYLEFAYPFGVESFSYSPWCIEVSILTHLARHVRRANESLNRLGGYADEAIFQSIVSPALLATYLSKCREFVDYNTRRIANDQERANLQIQMEKWITSIADKKPVSSLWTALLSSYATWDLYAVAMMYLHEIQDREEENQDVFQAFVAQLKAIVLCLPSQRPSVLQMHESARKLFARLPAKTIRRVVQARMPAKRPHVMKKAQRAVTDANRLRIAS